MKKNIVKLRGITKIAKSNGLYIKAAKLNDNTYVTGQGILPSDSSTINNLTLDEMTGKKPLSDEKARRFPFIINPFEIYNFPDGKSFDLDNYEDRAFVEMIKLVGSRVAPSKSEVIRGRHDFYLEDKELEHKIVISKFDLIVEAGNIIKNLSDDELFDIVAYIGVSKGDSLMLSEMTINQARAALIKYAQDNPKVIIEANYDENKVWIQVSKLVSSGVLKMKGSDFYEGTSFVASDFDSLVNLYRTDSQKKIRWDKKYKASMTKTSGFDFTEKFEEDVDIVHELIKDYKESLIALDLDKAKKLHDKLSIHKDIRAEKVLKQSEMLYTSLLGTLDSKEEKQNPENNGAKEISTSIVNMFEKGLSDNVIVKNGNWYSFGDKKFGPGKNKAIESLEKMYHESPEEVESLFEVKTDNNII